MLNSIDYGAENVLYLLQIPYLDLQFSKLLLIVLREALVGLLVYPLLEVLPLYGLLHLLDFRLLVLEAVHELRVQPGHAPEDHEEGHGESHVHDYVAKGGKRPYHGSEPESECEYYPGHDEGACPYHLQPVLLLHDNIWIPGYKFAEGGSRSA